ncbi:MAG: Peptidase M48 [uncultured Campylobacterales bacterium]|uniref:Peptidase M48 n=1 Tax=uncultured Campylobacterales bacterium TaxID=352960 RepID=A0A6S6SHX5_9BACT|nr:MAG: Peptidase M48 [uncultured Campylobacterales bacterium]
MQTLFTILFIYIGIKILISISEIFHINKTKTKKAVILSEENYIKAASYKISTLRLDIVSSFIELGIFMFWFTFGFAYLYSFMPDISPALTAVLYIDLFLILNAIVGIPMSIYKTFVLDKKYGFSNMNLKLFLTDSIKSLSIFLLFGSAIVYVLSLLIISFPDVWWIYGFVFVFSIIIFINAIYPTLIAPIFNKFKILEDAELKDSISSLLKKVGLNTSGIYTMDASKRDNRLNAYFGGLGKSKRVVLFDTLIKKLTHNELLAVLGHELGHFKHKDILKNIFLSAIMMFVMFYVIGNIPQSIYSYISESKIPAIEIPLFVILSSVIGFGLLPIINFLSRRNEYHADEFGSSLISKEDLANALIKLADENKSYPHSSKLTTIFYHSHPPLVDRLKELGKDYEIS